jgi:glycosyltransferase involved in cell wall biosynthesis
MKRLIQLIPSHHARDAAGSELLTIEKVMQEAGWQVECYADQIDEELRGHTKPFSQLDQTNLEDTLILYHFCGGSEMTAKFAQLQATKAIIYHNITPGQFFMPYAPHIAAGSDEGRKQLPLLAKKVKLAIGHSDYSTSELRAVGFKTTRTIPFLFDPQRTRIEPDPAMMQKLAAKPMVFFVGRLVPNKAPDHFVEVAREYFKAGKYPDARFVQVGKSQIVPAYSERVEKLIKSSGLTEDQLLFAGEVSEAELMACFSSASLFLSLSRHEGFCVPILEAMHFDLPVLALSRAAVPETLGEAGVLFDIEDPARIAAIIGHLLADEERMQLYREKGRDRLQRYRLDRWSFVLKTLLEEML